MQPERLLTHQKTTPTTPLHCVLAKELRRVGCSPDFEEYLPPREQSTFHLLELTRDCGRIRLPLLLRWSI